MRIKGFSTRLLERLGKVTAEYETSERLRKEQARKNRKVHKEDGSEWRDFKTKMKYAFLSGMVFSAYLLVQRPKLSNFDIFFVVIYWAGCIFFLRNSIFNFFKKMWGPGE